MKRMRGVMLAVVLGVIATQASAQFGGMGGGGMGGGMGGGGMGGGMGGRPGRNHGGNEAKPPPAAASATDMADALARQLDNLAFQLKLTPAQEPLWEKYRDQVYALVGDGLRPPRVVSADTANALQQIERRLDQVRNRLTALEDVAAAAARLYAVLDPRQQGLADRLLAGTLPAMYGPAGMPGRAGQDIAAGPGPAMPR